MNATLLLLFIPPLIVIAVFKYVLHSTITWLESAIQLFVAMVITGIVWSISQFAMMADTELLNGQVTGKAQERTSCGHSYQCRCRNVTSGSGENRTTTRVCDTCYEHPYDLNWSVKSTVGEFNIDRIDRQGTREPPRWTIVQNGQPVAVAHGYTNYIRGAPDSLFNMSLSSDYKGKLPEYPTVYDYHYADRVIPVGVTVPDIKAWNYNLATSLNTRGAAKQANIVMVLTKDGPAFAEALRAKWLGGKKNDIVVVVGTDYPTIKWVRVFSWAKQDIINVALRNELLESNTLDKVKTIAIIGKNIDEHYARRPMEDFKYLADEAVPPIWALIVALILGVGAAVGVGVLCHREDISFSRLGSYRS